MEEGPTEEDRIYSSEMKEYELMSDKEVLELILTRLDLPGVQVYSSYKLAKYILHLSGQGDGAQTHPQHAQLYERVAQICNNLETKTQKQLEELDATQAGFRAIVTAWNTTQVSEQYTVQKQALATTLLLYIAAQENEVKRDSLTWITIAAQLTPEDTMK